MRSREFLMKDAYSFDLDQAGARHAYNRMFVAYLRTFESMGLKSIPMRADTGPIGGDLSHEFIILAATGESQVFCHKDWLETDVLSQEVGYDDDLAPFFDKYTSLYAATEEMHDPATCPVPATDLVTRRGIEIGHIFYFGTKYSAPMNAVVQGPDGQMVPVQMGSYGIGVSRLVGGIIEASHDDQGIIWPDAVAPFPVGIINMRAGDAACDAACATLYQQFANAGIEALYDDTDDRAGAKFARMDLIGLPWQIVVGPKGLEKGVVELKRRKSGEKTELTIEDAVRRVVG
jgi:prolyl-tRNA synthetase